MDKYSIMEVVRGLGRGGAELALLARLQGKNLNFESRIVNLNPDLDDADIRDSLLKHVPITNLEKRPRYWRLWEVLKVNQPDFVIVRTPIDAIFVGLMKLFRHKHWNSKLIFEVHSSRISPKRIWSTVLAIPLFLMNHQIDLAICVSNEAKEGEQSRGLKNVQVLPFGTPMQISPDELTHNPYPQLLFVGRMVPSKRPDWLIHRLHAVSKVMDLPTNVLVMVGDGPLLPKVRRLVDEFSLTANVKIIGQTKDVRSWYITSNSLILCSTFEGLPLVLMEGRMSGLRLLMTPLFKDSSQYCKEDYVASSNDDEEFEGLLLRAIHDSQPSEQERRARAVRFSFYSSSSFSLRYFAQLHSLA